MKKILGLLGILTISGSGMSGVIGNAPSKTKEILENDSKLFLMRVKRQVNQINFENWKTKFNIWKTDVENSKTRLSRSGNFSNITEIIN